MCTVTFVPKNNNDFILTSNRDEAPNRISTEPDIYTVNGVKLLFPKDEMSGGTWIGVSEKNRLICILNGGFDLHVRKESYRESRGVVAKNFLTTDGFRELVETYNFNDIEPFTMVIVDWNVALKLHELVWDGSNRHFKELPLEPKIWSSATLFSKFMKNERVKWFDEFKFNNELNTDSLLKFHKTAGAGNEDYGVIMNRGFVKTTSITQVEKTENTIKMHHENLRSHKVSDVEFHLHQNVNE